GYCGGKLHFHMDRYGKPRVYCYTARQTTTKACPQRYQFLTPVEDQLGAYLATFQLPEETVAEVVRLYERANQQQDDTERRRRELTGRLERLGEMYKWGDTTREAYQAERDRLQAELSSLQRTNDIATLLANAASFLRDLPGAWAVASPAQRNAMAR